jgi:hypothetical protein
MTKRLVRIGPNGQREIYSQGAKAWVAVAGDGPEPAPTARERRQGKAYVRLRLSTFAAATKAVRSRGAFVWAWLQYEAWRNESATVDVTNGELEQHGVSRELKRRILRHFEKAELISVRRNGREAVAVTLNDPDYLALQEGSCRLK